MDQKRYSFPDKIPVNRYPTHFPISGNRGFGARRGLKAGLVGWAGGWSEGGSTGVVVHERLYEMPPS